MKTLLLCTLLLIGSPCYAASNYYPPTYIPPHNPNPNPPQADVTYQPFPDFMPPEVRNMFAQPPTMDHEHYMRQQLWYQNQLMEQGLRMKYGY